MKSSITLTTTRLTFKVAKDMKLMKCRIAGSSRNISESLQWITEISLRNKWSKALKSLHSKFWLKNSSISRIASPSFRNNSVKNLKKSSKNSRLKRLLSFVCKRRSPSIRKNSNRSFPRLWRTFMTIFKKWPNSSNYKNNNKLKGKGKWKDKNNWRERRKYRERKRLRKESK